MHGTVGSATPAGFRLAPGRVNQPGRGARIRTRFRLHPVGVWFSSATIIEQWFMRQLSVLNKSRKPIGYLDVAALKRKWEAGEADPVRAPTRFGYHPSSHVRTNRMQRHRCT